MQTFKTMKNAPQNRIVWDSYLHNAVHTNINAVGHISGNKDVMASVETIYIRVRKAKLNVHYLIMYNKASFPGSLK